MIALLVSGGFALAIGAAVALLVARTRRSRRQANEHARLVVEAEARRAAEETRAAAEAAAQRQAEEKAMIAAEAEARRQADEHARLAAEAEARRAAEEARVAAEAAVQREAEEKARAAAEAETLRHAGEYERFSEAPARSRAEEEARAAAEGEPQRNTEVEPGPVADGVPAEQSSSRRRAPQYHPPSGRAPVPPLPSTGPTATTPESKLQSTATRNQPARMELRILFERGGYCRVSLLPRRPQGLPEECTLSTATGSIDLFALEDEWYQDIVPDDLGALLRTGLVWTDEATGQEWLLAGREIFVLATGTTHRGFVSSPRLVLGREHTVLCTIPRFNAVEDVLREAGCNGWSRLGADDGAPQGWIALCEMDGAGRFRGLIPRNPVPVEEGSDILNVLRPLPEIEIALEGGVPLGYNSWLAGQPPTIRIYGDPEHTQTVLIDRQEATCSERGTYTVPGWDKPGTHEIWCSGATSKYSLVPVDRSLSPWAAYSFPSSGRSTERIAICGPLVCPFADGEPFAYETTREVINFAPSNPVLLGALPGEIFVAATRDDVRGAQCVALPSFAPVWALPAQPLHCDKNVNRILLVGGAVGPGSDATSPPNRNSARAVEWWWRLILDASRKGLSVEPATPAAAELWRQYKRRARELRRTNR